MLQQRHGLKVFTVSSSLRYKTNVQPYAGGLDVVNGLKPVTFNWKDGGAPDIGFIAEDIAAVEPLLVTHNESGKIEGVKYERMGVVFVNAPATASPDCPAASAALPAARRD